MDRERLSTGTDWESAVGYSRAVKVGNEILVSGTTATDEEGSIVGPDDPYRQTEQTIANIEAALSAFDASLADVVRTRMFVTDVEVWEDIGRAHREAFEAFPPATAMVEIARLVDPAMCIEMEAEARV